MIAAASNEKPAVHPRGQVSFTRRFSAGNLSQTQQQYNFQFRLPHTSRLDSVFSRTFTEVEGNRARSRRRGAIFALEQCRVAAVRSPHALGRLRLPHHSHHVRQPCTLRVPESTCRRLIFIPRLSVF